MKQQVKGCTVHELARLAGVSVRTLHHYDRLGLLRPAGRSASGYRLYRQPELLRLQQILLYREMDLPLKEIRALLDDPAFDPAQALEQHRRRVEQEIARLKRLLVTIERTTARIKEDNMDLSDADLYEGLTPEQAERYPRQAREMYDPALVAESERRVRKMSKEQWKAVKAEGEDITRQVAALADRQPDDPLVQAQIARHRAWIEHFYPVSAELYRGLGQLYTSHPEFRAHYEAYRPGLADFMAAAMTCYADQTLSK